MTPKKLYMIMLGVLVLSIASSVAGYVWSDKQLKGRSQTLSQLLAERDAQIDKIDKLRNSKNSVQDFQKINDLINAMLPHNKQQQNLVADIIYTVTTEAHVQADQITNISFTSTGAPGTLSGTTVSKDIQGVYVYPFSIQIKDISYDTMLKLFSQIEKNKRIIQADQVSITPDKTRVGYITNLSLSLKTFVQP